MHLPDGFINLTTAVTTYGISTGAVAYSIKETNKKMGEKHVPLMGIMAAFVFAAQMLNFPVIGGTSGHVIGATLVAILLGPWAALLIMVCVLFLQAFMFQDGGLLALGANVFNMGFLASFGGYYVYKLISAVGGGGRKAKLVASFSGAWFSVVLASSAAALELGFSGTSPLRIALPAMAGVHVFIGIGEGIITTSVLALVRVARQDLLELKKI